MTPEGPGFNKIAGASLQAVGALLVLISLDGNLGLFAGKSIIAGAREWARDYPKKPRRIALEVSASTQVNSSTLGAISIKPSALDERVAELERIVVEISTLASIRHNELTQLIDTARLEAREENTRTAVGLRNMETKLVKSAVGSRQSAELKYRFWEWVWH